MIRKLLLLAFSAALALAHFSATSEAQQAERQVELRITGMSRGYLRPLRTTEQRIKKVAGLEGVAARGCRAGITRMSLKTTLNDSSLAAALGLKVVDSRENRLLLSPEGDEQAFRAEARLAILTITDAIRSRYESMPGDRYGRSGNLFKGAGTEQALKSLGLETKLLEGRFYKFADYHIEEQGEGTFRVWVGQKYEGLPTGSYYEWGPEGESDEEPDPKSKFVGAKLICSEWNSGFWWVDLSGASLNAYDYERDATVFRGDSPKLAVQSGADRVVTVLQAAARYRFEGENGKKGPETLHKGNVGNNWQLREALKITENYWQEYPYYSDQNFYLSWFKHEKTGKVHARVKVHNPRHPLHLDGDLDVDAAREVDFDFAKAGIHWAVGPESDPSVFDARRAEIARGIGAIRNALFALGPDSSGKIKAGALTADTLAALGLKAEDLKGERFQAQDYVVLPQMLGDFEVRAGSPRFGCESWTLCNLAEKTVVRSYR